MVAVTTMSLVIPPARVVPLVLILEVMASISLVPQVWKDIDWYSLRWLLAGSLFATPFGAYLLANIPAEPMRISISLLILVAAILLLRGWAWKRMPGRPLILTTGIACGILNGAAAIGGPPVILMYLSSPAGVMEEDRRHIEDFHARARRMFKDAGIPEDRIETKEACRTGNVGKAIMAEVKKGDYGTVVVGRRGVNRAFFMGSVSKYVLNHTEGRALWVVS